MQKVTGRFIHTGATINLILGFIPDKFRMFVNVVTGQTPNIIDWNPKMVSDETTAIYGVLTTGSSGATSVLTTAAAGVVEYNTRSEGALVPKPSGVGLNLVTAYSYATLVAGSTTPTARSTTVNGTVVRPTTCNGFVYECTTATGACLVEPTWGTTVGDTTTDSANNVWTARMDQQGSKGGQGVQLGATTGGDGNFCYYEAEQCDENDNLGDAANF